ncbi:primosomal protein N' family DNA-binding protein [Planctomonas psychrotolerans]|uniref:primosomal protein N' family DNA-binding protein n=1 Tax=Planctomonas psychrotolerans TaxID=2528712 RepID=UPI00123999A8|nr:primosomal protein N' [Planctomonas psychrotolerans]
MTGDTAPASAPIARVALDSPLPQLDRLFDYAIPPELRDTAVPGVRVRVPLRSAGRVADGFLVEVVAEHDYPGVLSPLDSVVSPVRVLTPEVWRLARAVADRSAGSAVDVLRFAIPPRQARVEKAYLAATATAAVPAAAPDGTADRPDGEGAGATVDVTGYVEGAWARALADRARVAVDAVPGVVEVAPGRWVGRWALTLAQAAAASLARGESAILALPDFRDQAQVESALATLVPPSAVARVDARQSNPDRYRAFLSGLGDEPRILLGTRSAVYAPAPRLGLIVLWDDGDPLHAEPLSPYASSRDVALVRQAQSGCALAFVGHSRSTEVERLVELGFLDELLPLTGTAPRVIPTVSQPAPDGFAQAARIPSTAWREARQALESGPVLVQVARPGYAPVLACASCAHAARCNRCQGPLGKASASAMPSCGWCGALAADWRCTHCEGDRLRFVTRGSGRTAEELGRAFPGVRVIVADGEHTVLEVSDAPALVVATRGAEPVAAAGYRAVLLLDGERMLARESLRVGEDCLRWWSNAAALAAPKAPVLLVGVGGALARALNTWRQADYARAELADRRALRFPPAVRVAAVEGGVDAVRTAMERVAELPGVDVLGPVDVDAQNVRALVRLEYAQGGAVASALRSAVVENASTRRKGPPAKGGYRQRPSLRVRFDTSDIL